MNRQATHRRYRDGLAALAVALGSGLIAAVALWVFFPVLLFLSLADFFGAEAADSLTNQQGHGLNKLDSAS